MLLGLDLVAAQFGVAENTQPVAGKTKVPAQDGRTISVRCLAYSWRELPA